MQATRNNAATPKSPPNIDEPMYLSLKAHILRLREKRKQEQEQDAAMERHKRDLELKRKRDALSLEEVNDQMAKLEVKLKQLKDEKNELFLQLKRVWNDDEKRKKQLKDEVAQAYFVAQSHAMTNFQFPYVTGVQMPLAPPPRIPSQKGTILPWTPGPMSLSVGGSKRRHESPPPNAPSVRSFPPFAYGTPGGPGGGGYPNSDGSVSNSNNNSGVINDEVKMRSSKDQRQAQVQQASVVQQQQQQHQHQQQQQSQSQQPSHSSSSLQTSQPPYTRYM